MAITKEVLDELLKDYRGPDDLTGEEGLLKQLTKALVERAMGAELTEHLGYEKHDPGEKPSGNRRNGTSPKTVRSDQGPITLDVPRDREGSFEPKIVGKHQRELPGFSDKILSMYARGMTTREIGEHLKEIYGTEVSPQFITSVTDAVVESLEGWRNRELEAVYPIVFFDAIVVKVRDNGHVVKKAIYLALAITLEGKKELLGLWIDQSEGAKFWLGIISELKNRGVQDILIAAVDGLSGFPDAIRAVYPGTEVQLCLVHVVRSSLRFVPYKDRRTVAAGLRTIYSAPTEEAALSALKDFRGS
jgi:putative transposase